ncbi:hypothetical protein SNE25_20560 [Mucilaginibacter sabulilitoris]|uniref:ApeA N-terminal domain-containing protein n=1 Tax=Mucilaginibacter sabulilitoris TaxID=1173583 RepID=A0ABZ0TJ23_9SPHI|nr:HEPN domain-containing protein [Mucilaginibacter sabulilitoris]WPU91714.1 hypothetical protein SNE25_20560 [Mucilaginibacter sabulilitoris]
MAKNNDHIRKCNGQWSVPDGTAVPGQLTIEYEKGAILLEIYSTIDIEGNNAELLFNSINAVRNYYVDVIWGFAGELGDVTLFQCSWHSSEGVGAGLIINRYRAEFLIRDIHLRKDFRVKAAKFNYPYLGGFFFGFNNLNLLHEIKDLTILGDYYNKEMVVTDNLKLNYGSDIKEFFEDLGSKKRVQVIDEVIFKYNESVQIKDLMIDALNFRHLLEFSYGSRLPIQVKEIEFADLSDEQKLRKRLHSEGENQCYHITNFNLNYAEIVQMGSLNQNEMLFSRWTLSLEELTAVIQRWFKLSNLKNVVDYYLESVNERTGMKSPQTHVKINNLFLNLIQGLEDFYREMLEPQAIKKDRELFDMKKATILKDIQDASLKQWLNNTFKFTRYLSLEDKLQGLVDHCRPALETVFKPLDWTNFPTASKDLRHTLSHGMNKSQHLSADLYLNYYMAKLLLTNCLLQALKISPIFYRATLQTNYLHNELFGQIITRQKAAAKRINE